MVTRCQVAGIGVLRRKSDLPAGAKAEYCGLQLGQVMIDCRLHDGVGSIEVAVSKSFAHPCNVLPGNLGLGSEHIRADPLDGLADLDEADAGGVEDEPIAQSSPLQVTPNRLDGFDDVL